MALFDPALLAAGAALLVGILGLIGVPLSAQVTGAVQNHSQRRKRQAKHESDALGTLLRAWTVMGQTTGPAYQAAYGDWLLALAEMAAYASSDASCALAEFVRRGCNVDDPIAKRAFIEAIYAVRRTALGRHLAVTDKASIRTLLFGAGSIPAGAPADRTAAAPQQEQ